MFPVTVTLHDAAQLTAVMAALQPTTAAAKVEAPKPTKVEKASPDTTTAVTKSNTTTDTKSTTEGTVSSIPEEKADPKPAAAATGQVQAGAQTASSDVAMTEADLTKVVVATVARVGKEATLDVLQTQFGVTAGKQITDPAIRAKAKAALEAL